jgi:hypothetical protein
MRMRRGRYTVGKDVAGICSFSTALPAWAGALGACPAAGVALGAPGAPPPRTQLVSFVGGGLGDVRQRLFAHLEAHPWPQLRIVRGHLAPKEYMRVLLTSKYCLVRARSRRSRPFVRLRLFVRWRPAPACSQRVSRARMCAQAPR